MLRAVSLQKYLISDVHNSENFDNEMLNTIF